MRLLRLLIATGILGFAGQSSGVGLSNQEMLSPDVHVIGFDDRFGSANCGWVEISESTVLIDLPRGVEMAGFLAAAARTGKPVQTLVLTHARPEDMQALELLVKQGIATICLSSGTHKALLGPAEPADGGSFATRIPVPMDCFQILSEPRNIGDAHTPIELLPLDGLAGSGGSVVNLPRQKILFGGPLVVHGPRMKLQGSNTENWMLELRRLTKLNPAHVVPAYGSWGDSELLARQHRLLSTMRNQVGYLIAQGRPRQALQDEVRVPGEYLVWMPYDTPMLEDLEYIYDELVVPRAPFNSSSPSVTDKRTHALVLIGDGPHEPGHIEQGLRPVFEAAGIEAHFTVDVRALSTENLNHVQLLVILRDGLQRPEKGGKSDYVWMTSEQQQATVDFVERGCGFLCLHNSMGLYPEGGKYLDLVGGRYEGHGPLERFRVEVVDPNHPITRDVRDFWVPDEQHMPVYDAGKVHLLLLSRSSTDRTAAAGWCYERGKGRVCYLANGHTREALLHPMYQRLLNNAVHWCLRKEGVDGPTR